MLEIFVQMASLRSITIEMRQDVSEIYFSNEFDMSCSLSWHLRRQKATSNNFVLKPLGNGQFFFKMFYAFVWLFYVLSYLVALKRRKPKMFGHFHSAWRKIYSN